MLTYISLLRGINVTGHRMIKMTELRALYESVGFKKVTTYIQSGNVVFQSNSKDETAIISKVEAGIKKSFGFDVKVLVRRPDELGRVIKASPFARRKRIDQTRLHVTFLDSKPATALIQQLPSLTVKTKDEYQVIGKEIFLHCPDGYGKTLLSNTFFEKNLKLSASTRNWNTVTTLFEMSHRL